MSHIKAARDGAGRKVRQHKGFDTEETSYSDALTVTGDTIVEQTEQTHDDAGNVIQANVAVQVATVVTCLSETRWPGTQTSFGCSARPSFRDANGLSAGADQKQAVRDDTRDGQRVT